MGRLSTHVLDIARGRPAAGVRIELVRLDGERTELLCSTLTDSDGRTDEPLLSDGALLAGKYRLLFHVGPYFAAQGAGSTGGFFDIVPVEVNIRDSQSTYHVPLLVTPWSYTTYRGS